MAQAFTKRFAGREVEVVDEIKLFGWSEFCKREGVTGFNLQKWFQQQPGCEGDSIHHYPSSDLPIYDLSLVDKIKLCIQAERSKHKAEVAQLKSIIEEQAELLKMKDEHLRYYRLAEYRHLKPIWEVVRPSIRGDPVRA